MLLGWLTEVLILNPALQLEGIMLLLQTFKDQKCLQITTYPVDYRNYREFKEIKVGGGKSTICESELTSAFIAHWWDRHCYSLL